MKISSLMQRRLLSVASTGAALLTARFLSFGLFVFSARRMSAEDNASLIYVFGMSQLIVQLSSLGWLNLIRRIAANIDQMPQSLAKGFIYRSLQIPCSAMLVSAGLIWLIMTIADLGAPVATTLGYATAISLIMLPNAIFREYLTGFSRPTASVFVSDTLPLAIVLASIWIWRCYTIESASLCLAAAYALSGVIQAILVTPRLKPVVSGGVATYTTVQWLKTAAYTLVGFGSKVFMDRMDVIFLASMAGLTSLAYYNSAVRLTSLLLLAPVILIPVFSPRVSKAFNVGNTTQLRDEIRIQLVIIVLTIIPAALILLLSPNALLGALFGADYATAGDIIWIVLIAQSLFALSLPFSNLLLMTDGEVSYAVSSAVALAVTFVAAAILIPGFMIHGAAVAMLSGSIVLFLGLVLNGLRRMYAFPASSHPRKSAR